MNSNFHGEIPTIELFYICDEDFHKEVDEVRKKFDIKINDADIVDISDVLRFDQELITNPGFRKSYYDVINRVCSKYNIEDYFFDVEIFVESGLTPYSYDSEGVVTPIPINKPEIWPRKRNVPKLLGCKVEFVVRTAITQKDLSNWFQKYKDILLIEINDNFRGLQRGVTKLEKLDKILKIIKLRDERKLSFADIAEDLCTRYPNDKDAIDGAINEVSVRKIYNRFKKRFKRDTS